MMKPSWNLDRCSQQHRRCILNTKTRCFLGFQYEYSNQNSGSNKNSNPQTEAGAKQISLLSQFEFFEMSTNTSHHQSKVFLDTCVQTEIKWKNSSHTNDIEHLENKQAKLKKDLAFWNSMAEGKLESIASTVNLFVLLLILTLGGHTYNGKGTNGPEVLGWICVSQVCFFYLLVLIVKFKLIPSIETDLQQCCFEGFKLYYTIEIGKRQIQNLHLDQLQLIEYIVTQKIDDFVKCFPHTLPSSILQEVTKVLNSREGRPYHLNRQLKELKKREKRAKWWQAFWQVFILGKTFTLPGVVLLVFIITPLSIATPALTSKSMNNAQGWLAVGFFGAGWLCFALIKLFLWDSLNEKVVNSSSELFSLYHPVYLKHRPLSSFNLSQLEGLESILTKRLEDFRKCFPEENASQVLGEVKLLINKLLPNKADQKEEVHLKEIISQEHKNQSFYTAWLNYFNQRLITTIINILKFLIVIAITLVPNYSDSSNVNNAKIAVGSLGIISFVLGYLFYLFLRAYYLDSLEAKVHQERSSPFTTFRLVYLCNKKLAELEVHQIEDVCEAFDRRKNDFLKCFPNLDPQVFDNQLRTVIKDKLEHHYDTADQAFGLLKKESEARKMLTFWSGYVDNPLLTSMYSVYVLLVLLLVTISEVYDGVGNVMGWIGVATLSLLIVLVLVFKVFIIDYMTNSLKALHVEGYSQYNLVYTKAKELNSLDLAQLEKIQKIIESNPIQFRKCFPNAKLISTLDDVRFQISQKRHHLGQLKIKSSAQKVRHQMLSLELSRCKNALTSWTSLIMDKIYAISQLEIVCNILWVQSIATTPYGLTVCGFLTVAGLAVIFSLIFFFNCYYRDHLQEAIRQYQKDIKGLEKKDSSVLSL